MTSANPPAPSDPRQALAATRSLVVKLGTQLLSRPDRTLDTAYLARIAAQIAGLRSRGLRVTVVSSGAVGAGMAHLKLARRPADLAMLQAVAAIGQPRLMAAWSEALAPHGLSAAQILLTRDDIDDRARYLNLRNTLAAAEAAGAVPIVNENDTVSTDEIVRITFGDNDILAALVAQALGADLLILLTVVNGLLNPAGHTIPLVEHAADAHAHVRTDKSAAGKGGMDSKVRAGAMLTALGQRLAIADGRTPDILPRLLAGDPLGTLFLPSPTRKRARPRWMAAARPAGSVRIDAGAAAALRKNRSLLPAGITAVTGDFQRGDPIEILGPDGEAIARGLTNYTASQTHLIRGKKSSEVRKILPDAADDELIHRDNLTLLTR